jgi:hypothetical protein
MPQPTQTPIISCGRHTCEYVTNFCCNAGCLAPLCPECIDEHNKYHNSLNHEFAEYDTLKRVQQMCLMKTQAIIELLQNELKSLGVTSSGSHVDFMEGKQKEFEDCRRKLHRVIDEYMDSLMMSYKRKMGKQFSGAEEIMRVVEKISGRLELLRMLNRNLSTKQIVPAIRKTCEVTAGDVMLEVQEEIRKLQSGNRIFSGSINIQDSEILEIKELLQKVVLFDNDEGMEKFSLSKKANLFDTGIVQLETKKIGSYFEEKFHINEFGNIQMAQNVGFLADNFSIQNVPNTINSNMQEQYMHYFQPKSNFLHLYPLESHICQYIKVSLNTVVPTNSRSVMTDRGHIYLTGGLEEYSSHIDVISSTHAYSVTTKKFGTLSPMAHGRFSHGICAIENHIYVVSGKTTQTALTTTCEKYDTINGTWSPIHPCFYPSSRPALVPFNNDTIFKVGGMDDQGLQLNLETYTVCSDTWTRIDLNIYAKFDRSMNTGFNYWLNMGGAQLNDRTLIFFGGHNLDGKPMRQSF